MENLNQLSNEIRDIEGEFKKKIEPYRTDLWKFCYRLTGSPWDAEDLVQETLLKSLSVLSKLFQPVETKAYLFKIATNHWIDLTRKRKDPQLPLDEFVVMENSSEFDFLLYENLELLIQELTPTQYVTLILSEGFGYRAKEIAKIIGSSEGAVHTGLSRTRGILRSNREKVKTQNYVNQVEPSKVMETLLDGFRQKSPLLIASVLDENITMDIVHSGVELGIDEVKRNSLKDWKEIVDGQHILEPLYIELWGRPVIIELEKKADGEFYLSNVHYFEVEQEKVINWKFYCFSYDLMQVVASTLNVKLNAAYFYHIF
ncbi:RNA polymerase sigma factor [Ornithinibacillus californiensis]|uniref:RNA polymerase sigma factor n=1 Tax=Ornithinibacillus californiensis TaxID=161536 RepID=UPI00064E0B4C|nr:RNA polymerase sigma factor [Ornithinibacillus californiensis]